jgi:hypothetical protein
MQTVAIFLLSYAIAVVTVEIDALLMAYWFGLPIVFSFTTILTLFVISPIAALTVCIAGSFCLWAVRFGYLLISFLPSLIAVALYFYALSRPSAKILLAGALITAACACLALLLCTFIINHLKRERILGL